MKNSILSPAGNLISPSWIVDAMVTVRDRLLSLDCDALVDARDVLALTLSECIGGLSARVESIPSSDNGMAKRTIGDGIADDFELLSDEWQALGDVPIDVLAMSLPPISGGAPDYEPTTQDWAEFGLWSDAIDRADRESWIAHNDAIAEGIELAGDHFTEADARAAGLAV